MATIDGRSAVKSNVKKAVQRKLAGLTRGLVIAAKVIYADSQKIVPVDYGPLKASGFIRVANRNAVNVVVTIGYTAAYAVYVHEDLDKAHGSTFNAKYAVQLARAKALRKKKLGGTTGPFRHDRGPNQQAKFLEQPFRLRRRDVKAIVAAEVRAS